MRVLIVAAVAVLAGCAANSGVVPMGGGTLFISKQAASGISGLGNLKAEVIAEATKHCGASGQRLDVLSFNESQPPYVLGNYPRVEITFRCM